MPNQLCYVFFGKANSKFDLTSDDYEQLSAFMKKN